MTQNTKKQVRLIYHALISIALAVAAVLLMIQCVAIYLDGASFTRETVIAHFAPIAVPVYLCIALVVAGFALSPLLPEAPDSKPDREAVTLQRLQKKVNLSNCSADVARKASRLRANRTLHHYVALILLGIGSAVFLWYALDVNHFSTEDINNSMIQATVLLLPCMVVPAAYGVFTSYYCRSSIRQETKLLLTAQYDRLATEMEAQSDHPDGGPSQTTCKKKTTCSKSSNNEYWVHAIRGVALVVGIALVVVGLLENGAAAVLTKAINICTECIGLG